MAIDDAKGWLSAIGGLLLMALGGIPILNQLNLLPFSLPAFMTGLLAQLLPFILAAAALWLIIDAFMEDGGLMYTSLIIGVLILTSGVLTILNKYAVIAFPLSFLTPFVFNVFFVVLGFFLIIAGFAMW